MSPDHAARGEGALLVVINHAKRLGDGFPAVLGSCAGTFAMSSPGREHELDVAGKWFVEGYISGQVISRTEGAGCLSKFPFGKFAYLLHYCASLWLPLRGEVCRVPNECNRQLLSDGEQHSNFKFL